MSGVHCGSESGADSRHLAIASTRGHVATFDWQAGRLHSEIQLKETIRDIKWAFAFPCL